MPMTAKQIEDAITAALPGATIEVRDLAGDDAHWAATGYNALGGRMGGVLHALQVTTVVPK